MRRVALAVVSVVVAAAGVVGIVAFLDARDKPTTQQPVAAPGVPAPTAHGGVLGAGNVVLDYGTPADGPRLRALAASLGAPDTPQTRAAGQAVVVRRSPRQGGVVALAQGHRLVVASPADPRLQDFIETWLGGGRTG